MENTEKVKEIFEEEVRSRCKSDVIFLFEASNAYYIPWLEKKLIESMEQLKKCKKD